jgi:hypothetical protein
VRRITIALASIAADSGGRRPLAGRLTKPASISDSPSGAPEGLSHFRVRLKTSSTQYLPEKRPR